MQFPIVFEEYGELILMRFSDLPVFVDITQPLIVMIGRLDEVVLRRVVHRAGKEIQKTVCRGLVRRHQTGEVRGVRECRIRVQARATSRLRDGRRGRFRSPCVRETGIKSTFETMFSLRPTDRIRITR